MQNNRDLKERQRVSLSGSLDVKGQRAMRPEEEAAGDGIQSTQTGGRVGGWYRHLLHCERKEGQRRKTMTAAGITVLIPYSYVLTAQFRPKFTSWLCDLG